MRRARVARCRTLAVFLSRCGCGCAERARWWASEYKARQAMEDGKGKAQALAVAVTGRAPVGGSRGGGGGSFLNGLQAPTQSEGAHLNSINGLQASTPAKPAERGENAGQMSQMRGPSHLAHRSPSHLANLSPAVPAVPAVISGLQMADDMSEHSAMDMVDDEFMDIPANVSDFMDIPLEMDMVHSGNDSGLSTPDFHHQVHDHHAHDHHISPTSPMTTPAAGSLRQPSVSPQPRVQHAGLPTTGVHTWYFISIPLTVSHQYPLDPRPSRPFVVGLRVCVVGLPICACRRLCLPPQRLPVALRSRQLTHQGRLAKERGRWVEVGWRVLGPQHRTTTQDHNTARVLAPQNSSRQTATLARQGPVKWTSAHAATVDA